MTTLRTLPLETLTAEAFAPYGTVIETDVRPPDYARDRLDLWRFGFASDSPTRLQIMRYHRQPMRFSQLERHLHVTETRVALGDAAVALIVAQDTPLDAPIAPPPESLRAFRLDQGRGVMFRPGAWHALDCFPLGDAPADFLFLSDEETEREIEAWSAPQSGARTHVVDYAPDGIAFEVAAAPGG